MPISCRMNCNSPETSPLGSAEKGVTTSKEHTTLLSSHVSENVYVKVIARNRNHIVQLISTEILEVCSCGKNDFNSVRITPNAANLLKSHLHFMQLKY